MRYFKSTELDKTVLLAFLVFTKGSLDTYISQKKITSGFAIRKRKAVRRSIKKLTKEKLLIKHTKENKHKFTKNGLKSTSKVLSEGAKLWKV